MIKEAYCSFEVAKLLKEKGFTEECVYFYDWYKESESYHICSKGGTCNNERYLDEYSMPTHQMAMAWLREEKKIYIEIRRSVVTFFYAAVIMKDGSRGFYRIRATHDYDEVVEAALKYALENLIEETEK